MYDLIIAGGGTAGCVLAERLTRSGKLRVLLIEAGGEPRHWFVKMPAGFAKLFKSPLDWAFESEPLTSAGQRRVFIPRGRMLGGSANLNALVHQWCHPDDFSRWEAAGAKGWGWDAVAPIFRAQEQLAMPDSQEPPDPGRGYEGPMHIARPKRPLQLAQAFVAAARNAGLGDMPGYNGGDYRGAWLSELSYHANRRCSVYDAYLRPAMQRGNLQVMTNTRVCKLLFEGRRAAGVTVLRKGRQQQLAASGVVMASGVFGTPQILQLSGLGPRAQLAAHGIPVHQDMPAVGANLQDHPMSIASFRSHTAQTFKAAANPLHVLRYLLFRQGLLASNVTEAMAFTKTTYETASAPDLELLMFPLEWRNQGLDAPRRHAFAIGPAVVNPRSRGSVSLRSTDPLAPLRIDLGLLTDPEGVDAAILTAGIRLARSIATTAPLAQLNGGEIFPGEAMQSDAQLQAALQTNLQTVYHPVGTCRMGSDRGAVVDSQLRVQGCANLWIADASVMPVIPRGHPNAVVAMLAQRGADWIEPILLT